jgi:NAD binding domain of 6-phosphogluconate dehydrogenase
MGANLARNAARNGFPVAVHNRTESRTRELLEHHGDEGELAGTYSTAEFVACRVRKAFMQLAGIRGADRVDEPRPVDPRRQQAAQQVGRVPQARAIDADDAGCSARHRPTRWARTGWLPKVRPTLPQTSAQATSTNANHRRQPRSHRTCSRR